MLIKDYIHIYLFMYVYACVCVSVFRNYGKQFQYVFVQTRERLSLRLNNRKS